MLASNALISMDGSLVAFSSWSYTEPDHKLVMDVYVRTTCVASVNSCVPHTTKISTGIDGSAANGNTQLMALTRDGRYALLLSSSDKFVPGDTNGTADLFVARTGVGPKP